MHGLIQTSLCYPGPKRKHLWEEIWKSKRPWGFEKANDVKPVCAERGRANVQGYYYTMVFFSATEAQVELQEIYFSQMSNIIYRACFYASTYIHRPLLNFPRENQTAGKADQQTVY